MTPEEMSALQRTISFSDTDLANALKFSIEHVQKMLSGAKPITISTARNMHGLVAYVRSMRGVAVR